MILHQSFTGKLSVDPAELLNQWQQARPDLDTSHLAVLVSLQQAAAMTRAATDDVLDRAGLNHGEFDLLCVLRRMDVEDGLTPAELTRSMMVSGAGTTKRLVALEQASWITRQVSTRDRRSIRISLTAVGRAAVDELLPRFFAAESAALDALDAPARAELAALLNRLLG